MITECYISELMDEAALGRLIESYGCGLELIRFGVSDNLDRYGETLQGARELLSRLGHPRCTVHGPFLDLNPMSFDSRVRQVTFDRFEQAYEAAAAIGADKLILHSGMIPTVYYLDGWAERMADFWNGFMEGKGGIPVCMENVLDREIAPFRQVAEMVTHPDFGICLDLGHAHCYAREGALSWLTTLSPHIRHIHVHDNDGSRDDHLGIGHGTIPFADVWDKLRSPELSVSAAVECADEAQAGESLQILKKYCTDTPVIG